MVSRHTVYTSAARRRRETNNRINVHANAGFRPESGDSRGRRRERRPPLVRGESRERRRRGTRRNTVADEKSAARTSDPEVRCSLDSGSRAIGRPHPGHRALNRQGGARPPLRRTMLLPDLPPSPPSRRSSHRIGPGDADGRLPRRAVSSVGRTRCPRSGLPDRRRRSDLRSRPGRRKLDGGGRRRVSTDRV